MSAQHKILVVDDAKNIRNILQFSLMKKGYKVVLAANGHKALDIAMGPGPPDLIILDIMMPQMDGYDVIQQLKNHPDARRIPVVFLSAKSQKKDMVKGLEAGADDYITKPFDFGAIHEKIQGLIKAAQSADRRGDAAASREVEETRPSMPSLADAPLVSRSPSPGRGQVPGRRHYAIMLTDIVGFSQGMEVDEDHAYLKPLKHNEIIRGAISKNNGDAPGVRVVFKLLDYIISIHLGHH
ncbi:MAG: response regulator, partial [Desulfobacterales bacterium]|nr:response regulator [Desulfobacterales bacterium]